MREVGYCQGIENYSRHLTGRAPGEAPPTLMDYFPEDPLLVIVSVSVSGPSATRSSIGVICTVVEVAPIGIVALSGMLVKSTPFAAVPVSVKLTFNGTCKSARAREIVNVAGGLISPTEFNFVRGELRLH